METTRTTRWMMLPALVGLTWALPAGAPAGYVASDYLPLAVGNSWTYLHDFHDPEMRYGERDQWSAYFAQEFPQFTIAVERTEELDGKTYFVISDMPALWPPAPPHFIAGKKLRWEGTHLMEHTGGGEQALYRFDGADETGYTVSTDEGNDTVTVEFDAEPVPLFWFRFHADVYGDGSQGCGFRAGYGYERGARNIFGEDHPVFINELKSIRAVLGGTTVEYEDALIPTSSSSSTWGGVKQSLFAQKTEEGTDR